MCAPRRGLRLRAAKRLVAVVVWGGEEGGVNVWVCWWRGRGERGHQVRQKEMHEGLPSPFFGSLLRQCLLRQRNHISCTAKPAWTTTPRQP